MHNSALVAFFYYFGSLADSGAGGGTAVRSDSIGSKALSGLSELIEMRELLFFSFEESVGLSTRAKEAQKPKKKN